MKKLILLLLLTTLGHAQQGYLSLGVDIRNGILGSKPTDNKPELNLNFRAVAVGNKGTEGGIGFELFERLDYNRMYILFGQQIELTRDLKIVPQLEPSIINRKGGWGGGLGYQDNASSHLSLALSLPIRYKLSDKLSLELYTNFLPRTDLGAKYDDFKIIISNFATINLEL